jgi:magnesium-transporting ATPase (P-type)
MPEEKQIYNLSPKEILEKFNSQLGGLSEEEAKKRLAESGLNKIIKKQNWRWLKLIFSQFNDALVWILLAAAILAFIFQEYRDVTIILVIVFMNAAIGFFQEFKAEKIFDSMEKLTTDKALVIRNGEKKEIDASEIVPGDIVYLTAGDIVPADGYILESFDLKTNSFIFTGETKSKTKSAKILEGRKIPLSEIDNIIFSGETIASGEATCLICSTGMNTEFGKIAHLSQKIKDDLTPMQKQMRVLGKDVTMVSVIVGVVVIIAGQYFGMSLYQNFIFALALSVSVVPEGLPAAISVALSLGMKRLLKHNVLAKKLNAVETLGSVSIICTDKTGTITKNELTVKKLVVNNQIIDVSGVGYEPKGDFSSTGKILNPKAVKNLEMLCRIGALCTDASLVHEEKKYKIVGDPTEGAIVVLAKKYNSEDKFFEKEEKKIDEITFSSNRMRMSVIYKNSNVISYVKGSPDVMLELCSQKIINDEITEFTAEEKEATRSVFNSMSGEALRVMAFAYRNLNDVAKEQYLQEAEKNMVWVGMMAMIDPPRKDTKEAIQMCRRLGIKAIMITGDYEITAKAIAREVGLVDGEGTYEIIGGKILDNFTDREIYQKIKNKDIIFARIAPEQKLRIASVLKDNEEVIAMTGDGVNDAPALKKADIGIAMGIMGTDVSKESADMILLDDNFSSIVKGIEEGRTIFQNLKKFIHFVFSSNTGELCTVIFGVLLHIPSPIFAVQILAIDLGTDLIPSFSLGLEPAEPGLMEKKFSKKKEGLMNFKRFRRVIYLGLIMASGATLAFLLSMMRGGWYFGQKISPESILYIKSTAAAFATLSVAQLANLLQSRSEKLSPFELGFFKNKNVIGAIFVSLGILLMFMYVPVFQRYLHMAPIDWKDWLAVIATALAIFLFEEARKAKGR